MATKWTKIKSFKGGHRFFLENDGRVAIADEVDRQGARSDHANEYVQCAVGRHEGEDRK